MIDSYIIINFVLLINKRERPLWLMDEEKGVDINTNVGNYKVIGYNYYSLDDSTSDSNGSVEDYLMKPWELVMSSVLDQSHIKTKS